MDKPRIIQLPKYLDVRGNLSVIEEIHEAVSRVDKATYLWL